MCSASMLGLMQLAVASACLGAACALAFPVLAKRLRRQLGGRVQNVAVARSAALSRAHL